MANSGPPDPAYMQFLAQLAQGGVYPHLYDVVHMDDDDDEDYQVVEEEEDGDDDDEEEEEEYEEEEEGGEGESEGEENLNFNLNWNSNSNSQPRVLVNSGSDVATTSSQGRDKGSQKEDNAAAGLREESGCGGEEWNRSEIDGLFCPICMEGWTSGGDHQVCCLPCGHIYGMSCITKWLQQCKRSGKCPQCNRRSTLKDIRVLYASRIFAVDEELQKKVRSLEVRCVSLEKEGADWCKKEVEWQRREADLCKQVHQLSERTSYLEGLLGSAQRRSSALFSRSLGHDFDSRVDSQGSAGSFNLQVDLKIDGGRFFDVDALNQYIIIGRRFSGIGATHTLTKMSLLPPHEREDLQLPLGTKTIKDLRISPHARLALLASLGKKLSVLSMESNNTIISYDLPTAAWSCSWDYSNSHSIYAGLQNGMVLHFDMRQTMRPVQSMTGLTINPVHTIHSLSADSALGSGVRSVLSASSVGLCQWNFGTSEERPTLIPESENQGVCISLACSPCNVVASFRPKVQMLGDVTVSQPMLSPTTSLVGQEVKGSHVHYKRVGSRYQKLGFTPANVNDIRLPKSAIIDGESFNTLFASGDEVTSELVLQELPSFTVFQNFRSAPHPIRDLKYADTSSSGLLCCLCEDRLQIYSSSSSGERVL